MVPERNVLIANTHEVSGHRCFFFFFAKKSCFQSRGVSLPLTRCLIQRSLWAGCERMPHVSVCVESPTLESILTKMPTLWKPAGLWSLWGGVGEWRNGGEEHLLQVRMFFCSSFCVLKCSILPCFPIKLSFQGWTQKQFSLHETVITLFSASRTLVICVLRLPWPCFLARSCTTEPRRVISNFACGIC